MTWLNLPWLNMTIRLNMNSHFRQNDTWSDWSEALKSLTTTFLMVSLGMWRDQKADKERFLTLTSSGQLLEHRPLSTGEDGDES